MQPGGPQPWAAGGVAELTSAVPQHPDLGWDPPGGSLAPAELEELGWGQAWEGNGGGGSWLLGDMDRTCLCVLGLRLCLLCCLFLRIHF